MMRAHLLTAVFLISIIAIFLYILYTTRRGALSLALFALFMRRQPMTLAQKLVQARVYAQGVTLASALCMAHFVPKPDDELHRARDYAENNSWKSVLHVQGLLNDYE